MDASASLPRDAEKIKFRDAQRLRTANLRWISYLCLIITQFPQGILKEILVETLLDSANDTRCSAASAAFARSRSFAAIVTDYLSRAYRPQASCVSPQLARCNGSARPYRHDNEFPGVYDHATSSNPPLPFQSSRTRHPYARAVYVTVRHGCILVLRLAATSGMQKPSEPFMRFNRAAISATLRIKITVSPFCVYAVCTNSVIRAASATIVST